MELSVAIQAKVEVTPSNWNFGFQPTYQVLSWAFPGLFLIFSGDFSGFFHVMPGFSASHCIFIMLFCAADNMK